MIDAPIERFLDHWKQPYLTSRTTTTSNKKSQVERVCARCCRPPTLRLNECGEPFGRQSCFVFGKKRCGFYWASSCSPLSRKHGSGPLGAATALATFGAATAPPSATFGAATAPPLATFGAATAPPSATTGGGGAHLSSVTIGGAQRLRRHSQIPGGEDARLSRQRHSQTPGGGDVHLGSPEAVPVMLGAATMLHIHTDVASTAGHFSILLA